MAVEAAVVGAVQRRIAALWPHLSERQRRLLLGAEARELGWGGVSAVAQVAGVSRTTVTLAVSDVESPPKLPEGRSRRAGGGRKRALHKDPALAAAIARLRGASEIIIVELPKQGGQAGHTAVDRRLVLAGGVWQVAPLHPQ